MATFKRVSHSVIVKDYVCESCTNTYDLFGSNKPWKSYAVYSQHKKGVVTWSHNAGTRIKNKSFCVIKHSRDPAVWVKPTTWFAKEGHDYVYEIVSRHDTLSDAEKQKRKLVKIANTLRKPCKIKNGEMCSTKIGSARNVSVRIGDLVKYHMGNHIGEGIVWRVVRESYSDSYNIYALRIMPVLSVTTTFDAKKRARTVDASDLELIDIVGLATGYARFGEFIKEETKRLSSDQS